MGIQTAITRDDEYALGMLHHLMAEMRAEKAACQAVPCIPKATAERMEQIQAEIDNFLTPVERVRMEWRAENGHDPYDMTEPVAQPAASSPAPAPPNTRCPDDVAWCDEHRAYPDLDPGVSLHRGIAGFVHAVDAHGKHTPITLWVEQLTPDVPMLRLDEWLLDGPALNDLAAAVAASRRVVASPYTR